MVRKLILLNYAKSLQNYHQAVINQSRTVVGMCAVRLSVELPPRRPLYPHVLCFALHGPASHLAGDPRAKVVHIVRHGEALHNVASREAAKLGIKCPGTCGEAGQSAANCPFVSRKLLDSPLSVKGREEAEELQEDARRCNPEVVLVSPLSRALETAVILFGNENDGPPAVPPIIALEQLRSQMTPHMQSQRSKCAELARRFPAVDFSQLVTGEDAAWRSNVRESREEQDNRAAAVIWELFARKEKVLALVTHFTFLLVFFSLPSETRLIGRNPLRPDTDQPLLDCCDRHETMSAFMSKCEVRSLIMILDDGVSPGLETLPTPRAMPFRGPPTMSAYQRLMVKADLALNVLLQIEGPVSRPLLAQALRVLRDHHPALTMRLAADSTFAAAESPYIPLHVEEFATTEEFREAVRVAHSGRGLRDRCSDLVEAYLLLPPHPPHELVSARMSSSLPPQDVPVLWLVVDHAVADARSLFAFGCHLVTVLAALQIATATAYLRLGQLAMREERMLAWERMLPRRAFELQWRELDGESVSDCMLSDRALRPAIEVFLDESDGSRAAQVTRLTRRVPAGLLQRIQRTAHANLVTLWPVLQAAVHFAEAAMMMSAREQRVPPFRMSARVIRDLRSVLEPPLPADYMDGIVSHFSTPSLAISADMHFWELTRALFKGARKCADEAVAFAAHGYRPDAYHRAYEHASTSVNSFGDLSSLAGGGQNARSGGFALRSFDVFSVRKLRRDKSSRIKVFMWTFQGVLTLLFEYRADEFTEHTVRVFASWIITALQLAVAPAAAKGPSDNGKKSASIENDNGLSLEEFARTCWGAWPEFEPVFSVNSVIAARTGVTAMDRPIDGWVAEAAELRLLARLRRLYPVVSEEKDGAVPAAVRCAWAVLDAVSNSLPRIYSVLQKGSEHVQEGVCRFSEADSIVIAYADHVGQADGCSPLATLREFCRVYLQEVVSIVHVLPFHPSSGDYGFAVDDYRSCDTSLGSWDDLHAFLVRSDAAKGVQGDCRCDLMCDLVLNHCSTRHAWFQQFLRGEKPGCSYFITLPHPPPPWLTSVVRARKHPLLCPFETTEGERFVWTTFSPMQVDLNWANPDVLVEFVRLLLYYVGHGARVVRLDAFAYLWKEVETACFNLPQVHEVLRLLRDVLNMAGASHVSLLASVTNTDAATNIEYFGGSSSGEYEADLLYNLPLCSLLLFSLYFESASALCSWLSGLAPPPPGRTYLNLCSTHDGIGLNWLRSLVTDDQFDAFLTQARQNGVIVSTRARVAHAKPEPWELNATFFDACKPFGVAEDYFEPSELHIKRFLACQAVVYALQGVPATYLPCFVAGRNDLDAVRSTGINRAVNRHRFDFDELVMDLADDFSSPARVLSRMRRLLTVRASHSAFHPESAQSVVSTGVDPKLLAVLRSPRAQLRGKPVLCLTNFSSRPAGIGWATVIEILGTRSACDLISGRALHGTDVMAGRDCNALEIGPYESMWVEQR